MDVTNYVLRTHGQPIHAFDASKVGGSEILVRRARAGEKLTLLDGRDVRLHPGVLVIADRSKPMALAGIMGGLETGVTESTTSVILESAQFSPELTREAARSLGLDTDASQRFIQGVDPPGVAIALDETARLLAETASGKPSEAVADLWPGKHPPRVVPLRRKRLARLLGFDVDRDRIVDALKTLEIHLAEDWKGPDEAARFTSPTYRRDLEIEEDLIEEVARVVGYDAIPRRVTSVAGASLPLDGAEERGGSVILTRLIQAACGLGFDELLSTALVGEIPAEVLPEKGAEDLWEVQNPMSRELKHLRTSILPGLLQAAARNLRQGAREVRLVESGTVFRSSPPPLGTERIEIGLVLVGTPDPWTEPGATADRYLEFKGAIESLLGALGIDSRKSGPYHERCWSGGTGLSVSSDGKQLARLGQVAPRLAAATSLERPAWAAVLRREAGSRDRRRPRGPAGRGGRDDPTRRRKVPREREAVRRLRGRAARIGQEESGVRVGVPLPGAHTTRSGSRPGGPGIGPRAGHGSRCYSKRRRGIDRRGTALTMTVIAELDHLERKIQAAAKTLDRLRGEKRDLERENRELRDRVRTLENSVGKEKSADWKPRLHALEQERTSLLDERRAMARRVEEMLVKLSVLEKAVHA